MNILVPLALGFLGIIATLAYESRWPTHPVVSNDVATSPQRSMVNLPVLFRFPYKCYQIEPVSPGMLSR